MMFLKQAFCVWGLFVATLAFAGDLIVKPVGGRDACEQVASMLAGRGKVLYWDRWESGFRVETWNDRAESEFLRSVRHLRGVRAYPATTERRQAGQVDFGSVKSLERTIRELKAEIAREIAKAGPGAKVETQLEEKLDFLEAYHFYLKQRAFPSDTVDWNAYRKGIEHREHMAPGPLGQKRKKGPQGSWAFLGPTNLDQPYRIYYGPRPMNGRVNTLAVDPTDANTIYLGAAGGGAWKTTDNGVTWKPLADTWPTMQTNSIAIDPKNADVVYVGLGDFNGYGGYPGGIMKSTDGGDTFTLIGQANFGNFAVRRIIIDPENSNLVTAITGRGPGNTGKVWRSTDAGQTWTVALDVATQWSDSAIGAADGNGTRQMYVGGSGTGNVYRSADRGVTWNQLTTPLTGNQGTIDLASSPTDPSAVYLLASSPQKIYKSTDAGATWTDITTGFPGGYNWSQAWYDFYIECSTRTENNQSIDVVYVGLIDVVQSRDGGTTWRTLGGPTYSNGAMTHNDQQGFAIDPQNPNRVFLGNDGGAYRVDFDPVADTWTVTGLSKNLGVTQFYDADFHPQNPNIMLGGTQDNASPQSSGDLANWNNRGGGDGGYSCINQTNPNIQYATSQGLNLYRTTNMWQTTSGITPDFGSDNRAFIATIHLSPNDPDRLYACTNYLWRWNEPQQSWEARLGNQELQPGGYATSVAVGKLSTTIYVGTSGGRVWVTRDDGQSWTEIGTGSPGIPTRWITSISINPNNDNDIIVGLSGAGGGHVWRLPNTAATTRVWQDASGSGGNALPDISLNSLARDITSPDSTWYAGTDLGAYMTTDFGATWLNITGPAGLPNVQVNKLATVPGTGFLFAATFGRGIWRIPLVTIGLKEITATPTHMTGGVSGTITVHLDKPAQFGGTSLSITSSDEDVVQVPTDVTVPNGQTSETFGFTTSPVSDQSNVDVEVTLGNTTLSIELVVLPPAVSYLTANPNKVVGGISSTGEVGIAGPAPAGGWDVSLQSNDPNVTVPASVTIPEGESNVSFTITTKAVAKSRTAQIVADDGSAMAMTEFTLTPVQLKSIKALPTSVKGGRRASVIVRLSGPAPTGGTVVTLSSSDTGVATVLGQLTIPAGKTFARALVSTKRVQTTKEVTITAGNDSNAVTTTVTVKK